MLKKILFLILFFPFCSAIADTFNQDAQYQVCFTPGQNCMSAIVNTLDSAKHSVLVQAFSFTAKPIAKALVRAKKRGVNVRVILDENTSHHDKFNYKNREFLVRNGIEIWLDSTLKIAHNKIMIMDEKTVITGSFNFTYSAQKFNAENVLIVHDRGLAKHYLQNWQKRLAQSKRLFFHKA